MFETEIFGPCLVQKLKCEGHGPPCRPVAMPLLKAKLDFFAVSVDYFSILW